MAWELKDHTGNIEFQEALRARMLCPITSVQGRQQVLCSCREGNRINLVDDPTHPASCRLNQQIVIDRHDAVRDKLVRFIKREHARSEVTTEPQLMMWREEGRCVAQIF